MDNYLIPAFIGAAAIPVLGGLGGQALSGLGFGGEAALAGAGQALPYTEAYDVANLYANGITDAGQLADIMQMTGMDSFLATDLGRLASQGLSASQLSQIMGASYTPAELAGTAFQSSNWDQLPKAATPPGSSLLDKLTPASALSTAALATTALNTLSPKPTTTPTTAGTPSTYAPRGQVGYDPLLSLLAPKMIPRNTNSLLG